MVQVLQLDELRMESDGHNVLAGLLAILALGLQSCAAASNAAPPASAGTVSQTGMPPGGGGSASELPKLPPDPAGQGRVLTDYFRTHELPLVGANVVDNHTGRQVILYGFVATPFGKTDAEAKARRIFNDPNLIIANRIAVRPELLTMSKSAPGAENSSATNGTGTGSALGAVSSAQSYPAPDQSEAIAYQQQSYQQQSYQQQGSQSTWVDILMTVLMIAPMFIP